MRLDRTSVSVLLLVAAIAAFQLVHYYPLLQDRVAVHFGASGEANGWSSRGGFVAQMAVTEALVVLFGLGLAAVLDRIPAALVNIPNRRYWLSPERRAESVEFIRSQLVWIEVATLGFLVAITQLIIGENLSDTPPRLPVDFWYVLAAFVGVVLFLAAKILVRFASTEGEGAGTTPPHTPPRAPAP
jgi:uncharacterized membrane protein